MTEREERAAPAASGAPPGPRSHELARRLREVESRNVTWMGEGFPVFWEEAAGSRVVDVDGHDYLDFTGAFGVAFAGHRHPHVRAAVEAQAGRLVHGMGDVHPPARKVELLERLARIVPWRTGTRGVLAGSGSEAVEIALKTALLATGRPGVVAFQGGYHGLTAGALAVTHRKDFRAPFAARLYGGVTFAPFPDPRGGEEALAASLDAVESALESGAGGDPVGTVLVEPVQGRAGVRIPPPGFLPALAERARAAGALLVLDEVFTGLGRTGRMFACQHEDVAPDLLTVGKSLGGGLPLAACLGPPAIMDAWPASTGEALHTSTFLGHPLACAAALAFLDVVEAEGLVERAARMGEVLLGDLRAALEGVPAVAEVRGRGLMLGIELRDASGRPAAGAGARVAAEALGRGLLVLPAGESGEVVELAPPAVLEPEEAEWGVERLTRAIGVAVGAA